MCDSGFTQFLKVFESLGKMGYAFQGLESLWKLSGVCGSLWICGLQSAREKLSAYQSETAVPNTEQQLKKNKKKTAKLQWKHTSCQFWLIKCKAIGYSKGCTPLPDVWKTWVLYVCCFSMPYCKGLWKVCESERIFCMNPVRGSYRPLWINNNIIIIAVISVALYL